MADVSLVRFDSGDCHWTSLMITMVLLGRNESSLDLTDD